MVDELEIYRELQEYLDKLPVGFPRTVSGVEIRILKYIFNPLEARIALKLTAIPNTLENIFKKVKHLKEVTSIKKLELILNKMVEKRIIFHVIRDKISYYAIMMYVIGFFEAQVNQLTPDFMKDVKLYQEEAFGEEYHRVKFPQMRTIPIESSITPELTVGDQDNIIKLVEMSNGPFAAMNCICKQGMALLGKECKQVKDIETCLLFGIPAQIWSEDKIARRISKKEMINKIKTAGESGLVLQPINFQGVHAICCCCGCCCLILTSAKKFQRPAELFASNYHAVKNEELCIDCQTCLKRCQMDAIHIIDEKPIINLDRCIGCGLCVSTCPQNAIHLQKKEIIIHPPKDASELYQQILKRKKDSN